MELLKQEIRGNERASWVEEMVSKRTVAVRRRRRAHQEISPEVNTQVRWHAGAGISPLPFPSEVEETQRLKRSGGDPLTLVPREKKVMKKKIERAKARDMESKTAKACSRDQRQGSADPAQGPFGEPFNRDTSVFPRSSFQSRSERDPRALATALKPCRRRREEEGEEEEEEEEDE